MTDFDKQQKANRQLDLVVDRLTELRYAAATFGMENVIADLTFSIKSIEEARKSLNDTIHQQVHDQFRRAQESSANMIHAALAGITIGKKET